MLIDQISHVTTNFNDYKQAEASIKRLKNINLEPIEDDKENLTRISNIEGKIRFEEVNFAYKRDNQVLKNINLEISEVMRGNLFSKIQKIEMNSLEKISAGDITYRLTEDADRVSEVIYKTAQDTIPCTLQLLAVIIYMFYLDWSLTLSTFFFSTIDYSFS